MMYGNHGWMWDANGWGWVGWVLMCVLMVLFWGGVITAIVLAIRYLAGTRQPSGRPPGYQPSHPEDLLAERFARGEIEEDEYRRRATLLSEHR